MKFIDSTVRDIYSIAADLVNDGMEVTRGYEKLVSALDVWQQQILRKCGPFVRPTTSKASKPQGGKPTNAVSSATGMDKKKRSRGIGRKSHCASSLQKPTFYNLYASSSHSFGLFLHNGHQEKVQAGGTKAAKKYEPGTIEELPCSLLREKQRKLPLNRSGHKGDLRDHLAKKQQIFLH